MKLIFMRHAQSEYNANSLINQEPSIKVGITEKGKEQALEVARKLKAEKFDIIFISEFLRVRETAEIVRGKRDVEIKTDKRINEIKIGFEGENAENYRKARRESGEKINLFKASKELESFHDVRLRMEKFVSWLEAQDYENVLIVTHEICCQSARSIFEGIDEEEAFSSLVGNCEYFEYEI